MSELSDTIGLLSVETALALFLIVAAIKLYKCSADSILESDCAKCFRFRTEAHNPGAEELPHLNHIMGGNPQERKLSEV